MNETETLSALALTRISYFNVTTLRQLYERLGSATAVVEHRNDIGSVVPDATPRLVEALQEIEAVWPWAVEELQYCRQHDIEPLTIADERYPERLRHCDDAPLLLFYRGATDLNQRRVVSIVGTRHCTSYGQDLVRRFVGELRERCPQVLIVSGLAYGVDINAHRNALENGYDTVAVLAHGLDQLYPPRHRQTADEMVKKGGLLTEYATKTRADKYNFLRRNRIVAGMADAVIVVESAERGGALHTARLASEYGRDVFAFPGAVGAPYSEGCNNLIRDNKAALITSAEDFVNAMGWQEDNVLAKAQRQGIERQMFPDLSAEEQLIVDTLKEQNNMQVNMISIKTNLPVARLASLLFQLEMKGVVRPQSGGIYHLIL